MEFSETIKELRKQVNLSQEEFAKKLFVSRQAVSNWETGKNLPDIETLIQISTVFDISLDDLIFHGRKDKNEMCEKLIQDGSEVSKKKYGFYFQISGVILIILGVFSFLIKSMSFEYVDANGVLHENFFLILVGYGCCILGLIFFLLAKHQNNKVA